MKRRIVLWLVVLTLAPLVCFGQNTEEEGEEEEENQVQFLPPLAPITPGTAQSDLLVGLKYENIDVE